MSDTKYIGTVDTAKLIRKHLKKAFPDTKFSVRSSIYSGGSSISVSYTNGPKDSDVESICKSYEGSGFDGMIDLKFSKSHWMLPNGEVILAHTDGTQDSRGIYSTITNEKPHPDAVRVSFGSDYVFVSREVTEDWTLKACKALAKDYGVDFKDEDLNNRCPDEVCHDWSTWNQRVYRIIQHLDLRNGTNIQLDPEFTCGSIDKGYLVI